MLAEKIRIRARILDFFSIDGLERLTGCTYDKFVLFMVKELTDNALDKTNIQNIKISIERREDCLEVSVSDDGSPTFTRESLEKILKFEYAPSSKKGRKRISRGVLGNALQSCFGISYAMWNEKRPEYTAEVWGTKIFRIKFKIEFDKVIKFISEEERNEGSSESKNTLLRFRLPLHRYVSPIEAVKTIAELNQHVNITYTENDKTIRFVSRTTPPRFPEFEGNIHLYSFREFLNKARENKEDAAGKFISSFDGFRHRSNVSKILKLANITPRQRISELTEAKIREIFTLMRRIARPPKPARLPVVGKKAFINMGYNKYAVKKGVGKNREGADLPFVIEAASKPDPKEQIKEAINFTCSIYNPFTKWVWTSRARKVHLYDYVKNKGISVIIHLICPNIDWLSPAKGELDIEPFTDALFKVVKKVCRKKTSYTYTDWDIIQQTRKLMEAYPHMSFTIRQIFYRLVTTGYPNTIQAYKRLDRILVKAQENDEIDSERITDLSRPEYINNPQHRTFHEYLKSKMKSLVEEFDLERWEKQPYYVEVWIEKEALSRVILPVCRKYRVNLIVGRGYSSYTQIRRAVKRLPERKKIIILYLGDHDPPGLHIEEKLYQRLFRECIKQNKDLDFIVKRAALTFEQIRKYNLPPSPLKKAGQKRREYLEKYGNSVWELDSLDPYTLIKILESEIRKYIEWKEWKQREEEIKKLKQNLKKKIPDLNVQK